MGFVVEKVGVVDNFCLMWVGLRCWGVVGVGICVGLILRGVSVVTPYRISGAGFPVICRGLEIGVGGARGNMGVLLFIFMGFAQGWG